MKIPLAPRRFNRILDERSSSESSDDQQVNEKERDDEVEQNSKDGQGSGSDENFSPIPKKKKKVDEPLRVEGSKIKEAKVSSAQLSMIPELKATDWQTVRSKWQTWKRLMMSVFELGEEIPQKQKKAILISKGGPMIMRIAFESEEAPGEKKASRTGELPVFDNLIIRCEYQLSLHANKVFDMAALMNAKQQEDESIEAFLKRIRELAKLCELEDENGEELIKATLLAGAKMKKKLQEHSIMSRATATAEEIATMGASLELLLKGEASSGNQVDRELAKPSETVAAINYGRGGGKAGDRDTGDRRSAYGDGGYKKFQLQGDHNRRPSPYGGNHQREYDQTRRFGGENRRERRAGGRDCNKCGRDCGRWGRCPAENRRCDRCNETGHFGRKCPEKRNNPQQPDSNRRVSNVGQGKVKLDSDDE